MNWNEIWDNIGKLCLWGLFCLILALWIIYIPIMKLLNFDEKLDEAESPPEVQLLDGECDNFF